MASFSNKAYHQIKRRIISLEMPPGSVIDEEALKKELGISRTPIREALQRLAREYLVAILPRRGMFVADIGITDLRQIFEARIPLEAACARLAAERAEEQSIAAMESLVQQIPAVCLMNDCRALMSIDEQMHELLARASNSKFVADGVGRLHALSLRFWHLTRDQMRSMEDAMREHIALVEALKRRDPEAAEAAIRRHLTDFQTRVRAVI